MRLAFFLLIGLAFAPVYSAGQTLSERKIEANYADQSISTIFEDLEQKFGIRFFYPPDILDDVRATAKADGQTIALFLDQLLINTGLTYSIYENSGIIIATEDQLNTDFDQSYYADRKKQLQRNKNIVTDKKIVRVLGEATKARPGSKAKIQGFAIDDKTQETIIGATIFLEPSGLGTVTDATGQFELELPVGTHAIRIQSVGYQTLEEELMLHEGGRLDFALAREAVELTEVVVEAAAPDDNVRSAQSGVEQLDVQTMKRVTAFLGEVDVVKSLLSLPGVSTVGEGSGGFNVRGGTVDQNLIMQDGAIMFNTSHVLGFFSLFNPDMVKNVTLYKGSMSSRYGGRLSSVLDVEMKEGNFRQWTGKGGLGLISSRLVLDGPLVKGRTSLIVGGRSSYSDWILRSISDERVKSSSAFFYDANAKLTQLIGKQSRLTLSGYSSFDRFRFSDEFAYSWETQTYNLGWNQFLTDKLSFSLDAIYSDYQSTLSDPQGSDGFDVENGISYVKAQPNLTIAASPRQTIHLGADFVQYEVDPGDLTPIDEASVVIPRSTFVEKGRELAFYINDDFEVTDRISLSVGLRYSIYSSLGAARVYEYQSGVPKSEETRIDSVFYGDGESIITYSNFEPRASVSFRLNGSSSVKFNYSRTIQYISQISNTTAVTPVDIWQLSNSHILPQQAHNFSLGYFRNFDDNKWETSLEGYFRPIDNLVEYRDRAELLVNNHIETQILQGEGRAFGIELFIKRKVGRWTGWLGYTYSRTQRKISGRTQEEIINSGDWYPSNFDKPHDVTLAFNYNFNRRNHFSLNFTYSTGRPTTSPIGKFNATNILNIPFYSSRNQFRIPDYHRLDVSYTLEPSHRKNKQWESSWTFSVFNLYGRKNAYSVFFQQSPFQNPVSKKLSVLGSAFPAITYNFKF